MRIPRYVLVTGLLTIYALFMTFYFGLDLLKEGQSTRFIITAGAEVILITLTFFALRKRDRMRNRRN